MGKKDIITKEYMRDRNTFADAFNYLLYGGRSVIDPGALRSLDTTVTGIPYGKEGTDTPVQKFRDELKGLTLMEDSSAIYLLLGIENQSDVNYAMPVKDMVYDALQYAAQVEQTAKSHREAAKASVAKPEPQAGMSGAAGTLGSTNRPPKIGVSSGEYLTGFYKDDHLIPVITLVVFFSAEKWDGPRCIHDMFSVTDPKLLSFIPNYRINLIAPGEMSDTELDKFTTSLREVLLFIKYSKDKNRLRTLVSEDQRFQSVEKNAAKVINAVTQSNLIFFNEEEEASDVCKAIDDMRAEARAEGKAESIVELLGCLPGILPETMRTSIMAERDTGILSKYLRLAAASSSVEEFCSQIA